MKGIAPDGADRALDVVGNPETTARRSATPGAAAPA